MLFCRCEHLFRARSCPFLGVGELSWCNQLEPSDHRALLKSLKMFLCHPFCRQKHEGEVVASLGEVMASSWSQHGFPSADQLRSECLATSKSRREAKTRQGNERQSLVGRALPVALPSRCLLPRRHSFTAASSCSPAPRARRSPAYIRHMPWKNESVIKAFNSDASTTDTCVSSAWDRSSRKTLYE